MTDSTMPTGFTDSVMEVSGSGEDQEDAEPIYLNINSMKQEYGEQFIIEYKYFVKNKVSPV